MLKYVEGDLFTFAPSDDVIVIPHICNSVKAWGKGFVVPLGKKFPIVKQSYLEWGTVDCLFWSNENSWSQEKNPLVPFGLGETQIVKIDPTIFVCNMVAQTLGGSRPLFYNHLSRCMDTVAEFVSKHNGRIIAPLFGSGLAKGNWLFIEQLIEDCWLRKNISVTIYYLKNQIPHNWNPPISIPKES